MPRADARVRTARPSISPKVARSAAFDKKEAEERAWRTVNKQDKGGKNDGSGRSSSRSAAAKKGWETRRRRGNGYGLGLFGNLDRALDRAQLARCAPAVPGAWRDLNAAVGWFASSARPFSDNRSSRRRLLFGSCVRFTSPAFTQGINGPADRRSAATDGSGDLVQRHRFLCANLVHQACAARVPHARRDRPRPSSEPGC